MPEDNLKKSVGKSHRSLLVTELPQATKEFTMYRELAPSNIEYDQKLKLHKRGKAFEPLV